MISGLRLIAIYVEKLSMSQNLKDARRSYSIFKKNIYEQKKVGCQRLILGTMDKRYNG